MSRQITLTTLILRELMFEFPELSNIRAQSITNAGPEVYCPRIVPREIGKILEELNTDGLFQIFLFPSHAEVWHRDHWMDSNSRRWQLVMAANKSVQEWNDRHQEEEVRRSKISAIKAVILKWSPHYGDKSMTATLHDLAVALSKAPPEVAEKIPGLHDILYGQTN